MRKALIYTEEYLGQTIEIYRRENSWEQVEFVGLMWVEPHLEPGIIAEPGLTIEDILTRARNTLVIMYM